MGQHHNFLLVFESCHFSSPNLNFKSEIQIMDKKIRVLFGLVPHGKLPGFCYLCQLSVKHWEMILCIYQNWSVRLSLQYIQVSKAGPIELNMNQLVISLIFWEIVYYSMIPIKKSRESLLSLKLESAGGLLLHPPSGDYIS